MRQLWLFFEKYHIAFLFLILEIIGFALLFSRNNYQQAKLLKSSSQIQASVSEKRSNISDFFSLREDNFQLAQENILLHQQLALSKNYTVIDSSKYRVNDSSMYAFTLAKVITNQLQGSFNTLTISKGSKHGIQVGDGVITESGAIGKIVNTSASYALVMPLFNRNMRLNVQHTNSKYNGDLVWYGADFQTVQVESISRNAVLEIGDSIVTNQFSKSIPENTLVGTIKSTKFDVSGNFFVLEITPAADFRKLNYVYIVKRKDSNEIEQLEEQGESN